MMYDEKNYNKQFLVLLILLVLGLWYYVTGQNISDDSTSVAMVENKNIIVNTTYGLVGVVAIQAFANFYGNCDMGGGGGKNDSYFVSSDSKGRPAGGKTAVNTRTGQSEPGNG